jgi:hypothetical protein
MGHSLVHSTLAAVRRAGFEEQEGDALAAELRAAVAPLAARFERGFAQRTGAWTATLLRRLLPDEQAGCAVVSVTVT